ncbi:MAG: endonuclease NucS, partial [Acidimicrobiia bacterium]
MRIVVASCAVDYQGRLSAHLPEAKRLLLVKADGSVLVHDDAGGYKPLNWMACPCVLVDHGDHWEVTNRKGERLTVTFSEVVLDETVDLEARAALTKDGVEAHLQELLAANPEAVEPGLVLIRREHATPIGPVDLLCRDPDGGWVAIEVKRRGEVDGVEQLGRYLEFLTGDSRLAPIRGVLAAQ